MSEPTKAVFLSYAREDAEVAQRIADALRAFGVEVWFDQNELRGGDTWDQKIRTQIKACALFMPIVSARTEERTEGYFRREWKFAVDRTHDMAGNRSFIVPVVTDDTKEGSANVPDEFMRYQWTRLPQGVPSPEFVAQVKRLLEAPKKSAGAAQKPSGASAPAVASAPRRSRWPLVLGGLAAGVVAMAVYFALRPAAKDSVPAAPPAKPAAETKSDVPAPSTGDKSVAVLAFVDLSEAHNSEYLSDGISEELLNALAKIPGLGVAARTSAFSFKGKNAPIPEIARKLNVAYVVEGSVQRSGDRVKITAQLIKAADGFHVWSDTFTRDLKDVFAVEEEISGLIAKNLSQKLGITLAASTASAAPTKNAAAYEAYLRGRAAQTAGFTERTSAEAERYFDTAVLLDPDYALAWARIAETEVRVFNTGFDRSGERKNKARAAATTALKLDPALPEAHLAQARVHLAIDHDLAGARREVDIVEQLRPGDFEVPAVRVEIAYDGGQWGESLATLVARAVEADPQNVDNLVEMTSPLVSMGRFAAADQLIDRAIAAGESGEETIRLKHTLLFRWTGNAAAALAVLETMPVPLRENNTRFFLNRGFYRGRLGDIDGALADNERARTIVAESFANSSGPRGTVIQSLYRSALLEAARGNAARATSLQQEALTETERFRRDFSGHPGFLQFSAYIFARRGQAAEALAVLDAMGRIATDSQNSETMQAYRRYKAGVFALLGRTDDAIAELRAVRDAGHGFGYSLRTTDEFQTLQSDPRFQQLLKEAEASADAQPRPKK